MESDPCDYGSVDEYARLSNHYTFIQSILDDGDDGGDNGGSFSFPSSLSSLFIIVIIFIISSIISFSPPIQIKNKLEELQGGEVINQKQDNARIKCWLIVSLLVAIDTKWRDSEMEWKWGKYQDCESERIFQEWT